MFQRVIPRVPTPYHTEKEEPQKLTRFLAVGVRRLEGVLST